jgi:hypothetical protein
MAARHGGFLAPAVAPLAAASLAIVAMLTIACGSPAEPRDLDAAHRRARHQDGNGEPGRDAEALRALPYLQWSGGADPAKRGVVLHDRARAWQGVNLYTNDRDRAYLIDMDGRRLHTWRLPKTEQQHCEHVEPLDGGRIAVVCVNDALFVLDADSNVVLEHRAKVHHDVAALPDGGLIVPDKTLRPYRFRMVYFDGLTWLGPSGETRRHWSTWHELDPLRQLHPPLPLERAGDWTQILKRSYDYYHLNTVESLPPTDLGTRDARFRAGNVLVCLRNPALLLVLDRDTLEVTWSWGPGVLDGPHQPTMLPNGHLLVFDNGTDRDYSRVIEVDPTTLAIVWEYRADPPGAFHSKWRGSSERLPNGDTLICESDRGRVFEVTAAGETVWEFYSPEVEGDRRRGIYRFTRFDPDRFAGLEGLEKSADR